MIIDLTRVVENEEYADRKILARCRGLVAFFAVGERFIPRKGRKNCLTG